MFSRFLVSLFVLLLSTTTLASTSNSTFLAQNGFIGKTPEQIIDIIEQSPQARPLPYASSVTGTMLMLSDGVQQYRYLLGDQFYLSFAPYLTQTHPCFNHNLSGCRGELPNTLFDVKILDQSGQVLLQKKLTSHTNGFIGVWLPRDINGTLEVSYQDKTAKSLFSTGDSSQTCLTTLKLQRPT